MTQQDIDKIEGSCIGALLLRAGMTIVMLEQARAEMERDMLDLLEWVRKEDWHSAFDNPEWFTLDGKGQEYNRTSEQLLEQFQNRAK